MDRLAVGARDRGKFEADEPRADHDDPFSRVKPLAQRVGLGQVTQVAHAVELDAGQRRHPVARAGRQHEMAVVEPLAAGEEHGRWRGRSGDPGAGQKLDAVVAIERVRAHHQQIETDLAVR